MTETDWLTTTFRAYDMLRHVRTRASARKLQLLSCGCCRLVSVHLTDEQRKLLDVIERHADGLAAASEYERVVDECGRASNEVTERQRATSPRTPTRIEDAVVYALQAVICTPADAGLQRTVERVIEIAGLSGGLSRREANQRMQLRLCDLFREVIGNPFAERMVVWPEWVRGGGTVTGSMTWVGETARTLAVGIQADQAFDRMPILADALEEDGCSDAELLAHLRENRPHVRGCWALDLVLGKS